MEIKEMEKFIIDMSEDKFKEFCKTCTNEQIKTMQKMRFFHKLFNDPAFYKAVETAVCKAVYEELRRA
jgi:hypothetical protein